MRIRGEVNIIEYYHQKWCNINNLHRLALAM